MTNLHDSKAESVESVVHASGRASHARVARWVRRVEYPKVKIRNVMDLTNGRKQFVHEQRPHQAINITTDTAYSCASTAHTIRITTGTA